jgi:hypothetical protein
MVKLTTNRIADLPLIIYIKYPLKTYDMLDKYLKCYHYLNISQ